MPEALICNECGCDTPPMGAMVDGLYYCPDCLVLLRVHCYACDAGINRDDSVISSVDQNTYCQYCARSLFGYCSDCGRESRANRMRPGGSGLICESCFRRNYANCASCGTTVSNSDTWSAPNGQTFCQTCFQDQCGVCDRCGDTFWNRELEHRNGCRVCTHCDRNRGEWDAGEFVVAEPHYNIIGSQRRYGVELETNHCPNYRELYGNTIWECKSDCSIEGMEFVSPILVGDEGLTEITTFCAIARHRRWSVNRYCGYHAHFDVSTESWESLRSIAYAYRLTYDMWCRLVSENRAQNAMCGSPDYSACDIRNIHSDSDWEYFVGARDRFEFINWRAYLVHGSCEVRSHDATLDSDVVCDWIKLHARFMDVVKSMSLDELDNGFGGSVEQQFENLSAIVGSELADTYAGMSEEYGHPVRLRTLVPMAPPF